MSPQDAGGFAFPSENQAILQRSGMTMRDYFAAKAMQGDLTQGVHQMDFRITAERAYLMADAMLEARK